MIISHRLSFPQQGWLINWYKLKSPLGPGQVSHRVLYRSVKKFEARMLYNNYSLLLIVQRLINTPIKIPYFLEFFPQVLLISECANMREQNKGGYN